MKGRPGIKPRLTEADKLLSESDYRAILDFFLKRVREQRSNRGYLWAIGKRDYVFVRVLGETGLRVSEAQNLLWGEIFLGAQPHILVRGGKWRKRAAIESDSVFISADLAELLQEWENVQKVCVSPGVPGPFTAIDRRRAWQIIKRAVHYLGLNSRISPHTLRHYAITRWCSVPGASPYAVAKQARLRSVEIVLRYFHSSPAQQAALAQAATGKK